MATNIWNLKSEIHNEGHLQKTNYSRVISAIAKDTKRVQKGYKVHKKIEEWFGFKSELKWMYIAQAILFHIGALYTLYAVNIVENITTFAWSEYPSKVSPTFINSVPRKDTGAVSLNRVFLQGA